MTEIALSRVHFPVTTLGPGRRIGIWLQGCSIRCKGCVSADTWAQGRGLTSVEAVTRSMRNWIPAAEGITISGGEPFDQPQALRDLLQGLRALTPVDILVFSGYRFEGLAGVLPEFDGLIDALISEPFEQAAPQTLALRGSDNQRLHFLTDLGRARFETFERRLSGDDLRFDVMFDADGQVWLAGIPARGDFARLRKLLKAAGHRVVLSDASERETGA